MSAINPSPEEMRMDLMASISESIQAVSKEKEAMKVNSLSRANPGKVAEILYHYAMGETQTKMVRKYKSVTGWRGIRTLKYHFVT